MGIVGTAENGLRGTEDTPGVLKTNRGPIVSLSLVIRLFFARGSETLSMSTDSSVFLSSGVRKGFLIIVEACDQNQSETRTRFSMCQNNKNAWQT